MHGSSPIGDEKATQIVSPAGSLRPALYVANGLMALGVLRALADLGLRCPDDISIASTDTIPGIGGLRPCLTRTEHPANKITNEALRLLVDRIIRTDQACRAR